jgi:hypothetical protein
MYVHVNLGFEVNSSFVNVLHVHVAKKFKSRTTLMGIKKPVTNNYRQNHWLFRKKGQKLKSFELPPHLSFKKLCTMFFLERLLRN